MHADCLVYKPHLFADCLLSDRTVRIQDAKRTGVYFAGHDLCVALFVPLIAARLSWKEYYQHTEHILYPTRFAYRIKNALHVPNAHAAKQLKKLATLYRGKKHFEARCVDSFVCLLKANTPLFKLESWSLQSDEECAWSQSLRNIFLYLVRVRT